MKAAVFAGPGQLELQDLPQPHAEAGELVLKVGANTVCGTDRRILRGEKSAGIDIGVVLGHEMSGHVVEVGEGVEGFTEGDLVGVLPTVPCGRCYFCQRDMENICADPMIFGYRLNGGLAEYVRIPESALQRGGVYRIEADLSVFEVALAEPLGCVLNGARQYRPWIGDTAVVIGGGPIGLLHTQVCREFGATNVIVSDLSASRLDFATQLGATHTVNPSEADLREFVLDVTGGLGADIVVIAIGAPALLQDGLSVARKGGHVNAFAGFSKTSMSTVDPNLIHYGELHVTGTSNAHRADHALALDLIAAGKIDVKPLHTHTYPLSDVIEAIDFVASGEGVKVAVVPD
ncbi:MAG: zinc-binding dehydrogenase [Brooklawnia sp.]